MKRLLLSLLLLLAGPALAQVTPNCNLTGVFHPSCYDLSQFKASTSAQLRSVISDETGTGLLYFQGGDIGTPSAGVLTNATGLPISTGVSGLGTNVATALGSALNGTGAVAGTTSPVFVTPNIGAATVTSLTRAGEIAIHGSGTAAYIVFQTNSTNRWQIQTSAAGSHFIASTDNTVDIGASSTTFRPRTGYFGTSVVTPSVVVSGATVTLSGLGASTGTPNSLCLNGTTVTVNAALTCTVSSRDHKSDIRQFDGSGLKLVSAMRPTTFAYNDRLDRNRIGFVAEDLAAIDPRLAEWTAEGKPNSIDFPAVMGVLAKAIQEQQEQINALKSMVKEQQAMLDALPQFRTIPVGGFISEIPTWMH